MNHLTPPRNIACSVDDVELTALGAALAEADRNPWLASSLLRRLDTLRRRFAEFCDWLRALPRRLRRGLAKRWAMALPAAALLLALGSWAATAKMDAAITVGAGGCTLADAITAANTDTSTGGCGAGGGADAGGRAVFVPSAAATRAGSPAVVAASAVTPDERSVGTAPAATGSSEDFFGRLWRWFGLEE